MARMIDADALIEHIKGLPTWWADGGGVYGQAMKYPEGMFDVDDVVASIENAPTLTQPPITGDTSDGYHTFNELYRHRAILFSVICNERPEVSWKSKRHHDGTMYDGMFIVGVDTPEGQATYHYDIDPYWNLFRVKELELAPEWDGHTPGEAIRRIGTLTPSNEWVKVMEAINNAAVAYIEGGPYDNDLPGMEFALKIDRLSRDFVHPPEGEEEENDVIEITENL